MKEQASRIVKWLVVIGCGVAIAVIPRPEGVTREAWTLLAIFCRDDRRLDRADRVGVEYSDLVNGWSWLVEIVGLVVILPPPPTFPDQRRRQFYLSSTVSAVVSDSP